MKFRFRYNAVSLLLLSLITVFQGCGGDGGSDSNPPENTCSVLGVDALILSGTQCAEPAPVVKIRITNSAGKEFICSGSVVSRQYVLSAAHCFTDVLQSVTVVTGNSAYTVSSIYLHPEYQIGSDENAAFFDVAMLKVSTSISIPPLKIATTEIAQAGSPIAIFGYGIDDSGNFGTLHSGLMTLSEVTPNHLVAIYGDVGSDTCAGDSGGPAIISTTGEPLIVGVTSSGSIRNCKKGDISLFANVANASIQQFLAGFPGVM